MKNVILSIRLILFMLVHFLLGYQASCVHYNPTYSTVSFNFHLRSSRNSSQWLRGLYLNLARSFRSTGYIHWLIVSTSDRPITRWYLCLTPLGKMRANSLSLRFHKNYFAFLPGIKCCRDIIVIAINVVLSDIKWIRDFENEIWIVGKW